MADGMVDGGWLMTDGRKCNIETHMTLPILPRFER
jgi:hypothetical protein